MTIDEYRERKEKDRVWRTEQSLLAMGCEICRSCGTWMDKGELEESKCGECGSNK